MKQEVKAGQFHVPSHPGVLKKVNINGNIIHRYFIHKKFNYLTKVKKLIQNVNKCFNSTVCN